jgi:hypothetical protein
MTPIELQDHLNFLDLSKAEAARLLQVSTRTVTRWLEGEDIPGPVQAAIGAWRSLHQRHLAWKPDSISVHENDTDQIERQRKFAVDFDNMLKRVERRGGPVNPWKVDAYFSRASIGACEVNYHKLANGGFSISSYRRTDRHPDVEKDMPMIEDAAYCIAREYERFHEQGEALKSTAAYVRAHAHVSVRSGPKMPTAAESAKRKREIERMADELDELADAAREGSAIHAQYEDVQRRLHAAGFFLRDADVAAIARAFVRS